MTKSEIEAFTLKESEWRIPGPDRSEIVTRLFFNEQDQLFYLLWETGGMYKKTTEPQPNGQISPVVPFGDWENLS